MLRMGEKFRIARVFPRRTSMTMEPSHPKMDPTGSDQGDDERRPMMAWNSDPVVRDLAGYAKKHGMVAAIVIGLPQANPGSFVTVSYGKNVELCDQARQAAGQIHELVANYKLDLSGLQQVLEKGGE